MRGGKTVSVAVLYSAIKCRFLDTYRSISSTCARLISTGGDVCVNLQGISPMG
jgi:hypothetical protein